MENPPKLSAEQRRAIWAITHCRTAVMGGRALGCKKCARIHFAWHSCNHKACPQCGGAETQRWVKRELNKRVEAPYFLVTFTLPSELRSCFFGPHAKEAYDLFFKASAQALAQRLAQDEKGMRATVSGFTAVLHTWNQKLQFHPHLHFLVPGAGLDAEGRAVRVKYPGFLVVLPPLQAAFRKEMKQELESKQWQVDPKVWDLDWGVHIRAAGSGIQAIQYLGTYVAKTAIKDARIIEVDEERVSFRWRDRSDQGRMKGMQIPGIEFARRYLKHVLPKKLRSVRYYGFCHPVAKANRMRVKIDTGMKIEFGAVSCSRRRAEADVLDATQGPPRDLGGYGARCPRCPACGGATVKLYRIEPGYRKRGPPIARPAILAKAV